ncbi:MAG: Ig-like domain-containing protein [Armatimonadota bacterium]
MRLLKATALTAVLVLTVVAAHTPAAAQAFTVTAQSVKAVPGQVIDVPISVTSAPAISGISLTLTFDQSTPPGQPTLQPGTATLGPLAPSGLALVDTNPGIPGRVTVALAASRSIQGSGTVLFIPLTVPSTAAPGTVYQLTLGPVDVLDANLRPLTPTLQHGTLTILQPSTAPVASLVISPPFAELVVGTSMPFRADAQDAAGTPLPSAPIVWSVTPGPDGGQGTITQAGIFTGTAPGTVTVTASSGSVSASVSVRVLAEAPATTVSVGAAPGAPGRRVYVSVAVGDVKGLAGADLSITYTTSSPPGAPSLAPGTAERGPIADSAIVETSLSTPGVVRVLVATAEGIDGPGILVYIPFDIQAGTPAGTVYTLKLSTVSLNDLQARDIKTTVQDGSITVQTTAGGSAASVSITPDAVTVPVGSTLQFRASVRDALGAEIVSPRISWSVEPGTGSGVIDPSGLFTAQSAGSVTVRATADGASATARVTIEPPVPANQVRVESITTTPGTVVTIPIRISQATFNGADLLIDFSQVSPSSAPALTLTDLPISTIGTISFQALADANVRSAGRVRIGIISAQPLKGPGTLVKLLLQVPANAPDGAVYSLRVASIELTDSAGASIPATSVDGSITIAADKTPPAVILTAPAQNAYVAGIARVEGSATDDRGAVTKIELFVDGPTAPVASTSKTPFAFNLVTTGLSDGQHTIAVKATDTAGNVGQSTPVTVTVDNTPPSVRIAGLSADQTVRGTVTFTAEATDANGVTSAELRVDDAPNPVAAVSGTPFRFSVDTSKYPDGRHRFEVTVFDRAGNPGKTSLSLVIDNTPPKLAVSGVSDGQLIGRTVTLTVTAEDAAGVSSVELMADGAVRIAQLTAPPFVFSVNTAILADGPHSLDVVASDGPGNQAITSLSVAVDNTKPSVSLAGLADGQFAGGKVKVSVTAEDANGIASVELRADGHSLLGPLSAPPFEFELDTTRLPEGSHSIEAVAVDRAGNLSSTSATVAIDNTPPTAVITHPLPLEEVSGMLTIKGTARDATTASFGQYTLEYGAGQAPTQFTPIGLAVTTPVENDVLGQLDLKPLSPGVYTLRLTASDKAGNSTTTLVAVKVSEAPQVVLGDVNGDGKVSVADATLALRFAIGMQQPTGSQLQAGDLDGNGKIEVKEVTRILRYAVKLSSQL